MTPVDSVSFPSLAWTGSAHYVLWAYWPAPNQPSVNVAAIDAAGNIVVTDRVLAPTVANHPRIAWDAATGQLGASWETTDFTVDYSRGVNVAANGAPSGTVEELSPTTSDQNDLGHLAAAGGAFGFTCRNGVTRGPFGWPEAYYTRLDAAMDTVGSPVRLTPGDDMYRTGNLVWTGAAFVLPVEYIEYPAGRVEEHIYRFDRSGVLLGARQRLTEQDSRIGGVELGPRAAMGDRAVGVVWQDFRYLNESHVFFQHVPTVELLVGGGGGSANPPKVRSLSGLRGHPVLDFLAYGGSGYGVEVASGGIDASPLEEIVTGAGPGPGYGPQVKAFTGGEEPIARVNFYAYGTLQGGVHVTTGDLDGDGMEEIVTGAGPMPVFGPHVRGFDYDGTSVRPMPKVSFYAYGTLKYGVNVASGTVDGDPTAEILTGPGPGAVFAANLRGFDYDNVTVAAIPGINAIVFPTRYGLTVGAGDLTADGRAEILAAGGPDPAATSEIKAFGYGGPLSLLGSVVPFAAAGGAHAAAGDLTLEGGEELVATPGFLAGNQGRTRAYTWDGSTFQPLAPWDQTVFSLLGYGATCAVGNVGI